jgi:hypothetical protein
MAGAFQFLLISVAIGTFGGYPKGFDKSNFVFITPYESARRKWSSLKGVNLAAVSPIKSPCGPLGTRTT